MTYRRIPSDYSGHPVYNPKKYIYQLQYNKKDSFCMIDKDINKCLSSNIIDVSSYNYDPAIEFIFTRDIHFPDANCILFNGYSLMFELKDNAVFPRDIKGNLNEICKNLKSIDTMLNYKYYNLLNPPVDNTSIAIYKYFRKHHYIIRKFDDNFYIFVNSYILKNQYICFGRFDTEYNIRLLSFNDLKYIDIMTNKNIDNIISQYNIIFNNSAEIDKECKEKIDKLSYQAKYLTARVPEKIEYIKKNPNRQGKVVNGSFNPVNDEWFRMLFDNNEYRKMIDYIDEKITVDDKTISRWMAKFVFKIK